MSINLPLEDQIGSSNTPEVSNILSTRACHAHRETVATSRAVTQAHYTTDGTQFSGTRGQFPVRDTPEQSGNCKSQPVDSLKQTNYVVIYMPPKCRAYNRV